MLLKDKMQKSIVLTCLIGVIVISGCISEEGGIDMANETSKLIIDFLYLDLSLCERCQATDIVLDEALIELRDELKDVKQISVNKIKILSDKEAKKYDLISSPTLRINGKDIEEIITGKLEIKENYCSSCSEVCCGDTNCRTYEYNGTISDFIPKEMIKEAIMLVLGIKTEPKEDETGDSPCCPPSNQTSSCCGSDI